MVSDTVLGLGVVGLFAYLLTRNKGNNSISADQSALKTELEQVKENLTAVMREGFTPTRGAGTSNQLEAKQNFQLLKEEKIRTLQDREFFLREQLGI